MKIGIDIDGVLTDLSTFYLDYGAKVIFENKKGNILDANEYELNDILDLGNISIEEIWNTYDKFYTKERYTREFASEVLQRLKEDGHKIHIITARDPTYEQGEKWTIDWLEENNIPYDNLEFTSNKYENCLDNKIDLMIEDDVENIEKISTIIPVICFDNRYNQECKGENITRCYSWYDIYSKIKNKFTREEKRCQ